MMLIIGITGGIACGKTAVTNLFSEFGIPIIDADIIARDVVIPGTAGYQKIIDDFGPSILLPDRTINRRLLRSLIFDDPKKRAQLENILHPLIHEQVAASIKKLISPYIIISIPLLYETGGYDMLNQILVVDLPQKEQLERLVARDSISATEADAIIKTQASRKERLTIADNTIDNRGGMKSLRHDVLLLHKKYLALAQTVHKSD